MRILVVSQWNRRVAGTETYIEDLLAGLTARGESIAMWAEEDKPCDRPPLIAPGSCPRSVGEAALEEALDWKPDVAIVNGRLRGDLERRITETAPSVFFFHNYFGTCISGLKRWRYPEPEPCFRTLGLACLGLYLPRGCGGRNPLTMLRLYKREQAQQSRLKHGYRLFVTHSDHMKQEYIRHGFPAEAIHVIPFACFPSSRLERGEAADPSSGGEQGILFAGRMEPIKGGAELIAAARLWAGKARRPLRLTMVGDGEAKPEWMELAASCMAHQEYLRIEFPGWLSSGELDELYRSHHLFAMPSLWPEPFGKGGMEAGCFGCPSIAFATGGIPQWLKDGVNGHLADWRGDRVSNLAEAIGRCLADEAHYRVLRSGARAEASIHTRENHCELLIPLLKEASQSRP